MPDHQTVVCWLLCLQSLLLCACSVQDGKTNDKDAAALRAGFLSIHELQALVAGDSVNYAQITADALTRIQRLDDEGPMLNAIVETAPAAVTRARALGRQNSGLLAGVPFVVKANIDTGPPMRTHAGSLALAQRVAVDHAQLVAALEREGAILVGKSNLSEWANFRSFKSVSGWSSIGGQTKNPHVLDRNPCGSSSGSAVAVAAGLVPLAIGTETQGSIVCPAGANGIVGLKPTLGLVSRDGIIPIASSQDTAGPMARSVAEVAMALQVIAEPGLGDRYAQDHPGYKDYVSGLNNASLAGLRVGVWRAYSGSEDNPRVAAVLDDVVAQFANSGARLVDPVGLYLDESTYAASFQVMLHEFKIEMGEYFGRDDVVAEVIAYNAANARDVMPWFGQSLLETANNSSLNADEYAAALDAGRGEMQRNLDAVFEKFNLDVIVAPTNGPAWPNDYVLGDHFSVSSSGLAAISGRPGITLPAGQIQGLPIGITLVGKMWRDDKLLQVAHALEKRLPEAPRPKFLQSLEG